MEVQLQYLPSVVAVEIRVVFTLEQVELADLVEAEDPVRDRPLIRVVLELQPKVLLAVMGYTDQGIIKVAVEAVEQ